MTYNLEEFAYVLILITKIHIQRAELNDWLNERKTDRCSFSWNNKNTHEQIYNYNYNITIT